MYSDCLQTVLGLIICWAVSYFVVSLILWIVVPIGFFGDIFISFTSEEGEK